MDVVLRTPNGEAEISVGPGQEDVQLAELLERVTGRKPGTIAYVDGRAVPSTTTIGTSGALTGSVISTTDDLAVPPADARVELVQVAGEGAGARTWLASGRFRVGVGRRLSGAELALGPVDRAMFQVDVDEAGRVFVRPSGVRLRIDGVEVDRDGAPWTAGLVDVGGRVFALGRSDPRGAATIGHRFGGVGIDGTAAFNRPPRPAPAPLPPPLEVPNTVRATSDRRRAPSPVASRSDRAVVAEFTAVATRRWHDDLERRRGEHPDLAAATALADVVSPQLWQRRAGDPDVFRVPIGLADLPWSPPLARGAGAVSAASSIVDELGPTPMVPVTVDLLAERGIALVGGAEFGRAIARGLLVEAAVTHGPANLDIVVLSSAEQVHAWEWVKWLPHARPGGAPRISWTREQVDGWAAAVHRGWDRPSRPIAPEHITIVVVDEPSWWRDRTAPLRALLSDASMPLRFVVLTDDAADVPAVCTTIVTAMPDHVARVDFLLERRRVEGVHPFLASPSLALATARRLAPLDDPDLPGVIEGALPDRVALLPLLGLTVPTGDEVRARWERAAGEWTLPIGVTERGPISIDLVADGPHALVAGADEAGVADLVQSFVFGLAATASPDALHVALLDLDGRGTFDDCAELAHVVGVVRRADHRQVARLIRSLEAELRVRTDLSREGAGPLPRLVIVAHDIAARTTELPELLPALLGIGERGSALGIHLVLVTARPARVAEALGPSVGVRVALRLQDDGDSRAVLGTTDAARLPLARRGRGWVRRGADAAIAFQAADAAGGARVGGAERAPAIDVRPAVVARDLTPLERRLERQLADEHRTRSHQTSLDRFAAAIGDAARAVGAGRPRRPFVDPLPDVVPMAELSDDQPGDGIPYALADHPDEQTQVVLRWAPGVDGSLLALGAAGSGTTSLLVGLALGVAARWDADDVHLYVIDADRDRRDTGLSPLADLPHVGAVVGLGEPDRLARLVNHLAAELDRRNRIVAAGGRPAVESVPSIVLLIDDLGAVLRLVAERRDLAGVGEPLERVLVDGARLGICFVTTAKDDQAIPDAVVAAASRRMALRLAGPSGHAALGLRPSDVPAFVPGRAVSLDDRVELQLVAPPESLATTIAAMHLEPAGDRAVQHIDPLPTAVAVDDLVTSAASTDRQLVVPVGLDTRTGEPALSVVPYGEHVVVAGPPASGRSSILVAFAVAARRAAPDLAVFAVAPRGGPLDSVEGTDSPAQPDDVAGWVERILAAPGRRLVLVDDADRLGGPSFERLAAARDDGLIVVVAGRAAELRAAGHWSKPLQRFRNGVLLRPGPGDGDLVRVSLGSQSVTGEHRGVLVVGGVQHPLLAAVVARRDPAGREG